MKNWKKEFSRKFTDNILPDGDGNDLIISKEDVKPLMSFIQSLLTEMAKEMIGKEEPVFETNIAKYLPWNEKRAKYFIEGYNQKRQELIKIAKKWGVKI